MVITIKVKLYPTAEQIALLQLVTDKQTDCANFFIDKIREEDSFRLAVLNKYYAEAKERFDLKGIMVQIAEFRAIRASRKKHKRYYFKKKGFIVRKITTIKKDRFNLPLGDRKRHQFVYKGRDISQYKGNEVTVLCIDKEWFAFVPIQIDTKVKIYKRCMGVDLGIAKTAVVADWNGGNTRFFKGEPLRAVKSHYSIIRRDLQNNLKHGNVYKKLKRISHKETNWITDVNHKISREIVNMAVRNKRTIAVENLTGITERLKVNRKTRGMLKGWSFYQLVNFIKYKAELAGILVVVVDPRGTSKTCPICQHYSRSNRRSQERFICQSCGYESNADRIGAMNIAIRGTGLLASQ